MQVAGIQIRMVDNNVCNVKEVLQMEASFIFPNEML